jgi:hypothetical protein
MINRVNRIYSASCHCGAVRFKLRSDEITSGCRCNCSMCIRKGAVMSAAYYAPADIEALEGTASLRRYRFGDEHVNHFFCSTCGICPFHTVASLPPTYEGPAKVGDYRINLGCLHELDATAIDVELIDGRSF